MMRLLLALMLAAPLLPSAGAHACGTESYPAPEGTCGTCERGDHKHVEADVDGGRSACSRKDSPAPSAPLALLGLAGAAIAIRSRA